MNRIILRKPKKEFTVSVMYSDKAFQNARFDIVNETVDKVFEKLKKITINSLIQEKLKKNQDGVCIRAWIIPQSKF